jgi:hypothetical protein
VPLLIVGLLYTKATLNIQEVGVSLIHALTERVFFWPENRMGTYGKRFFNVADDAMLRVSFTQAQSKRSTVFQEL